MKRKILIPIFCFFILSVAYMLILHFSGYCIFPKLTQCRTTGKPLYIWNARRVYYHVMLNGEDTDIITYNGVSFRVYMSGFIHKSCKDVPVVNLKARFEGNGRFDFQVDTRHPKEEINFIILAPREMETPKPKKQLLV